MRNLRKSGSFKSEAEIKAMIEAREKKIKRPNLSYLNDAPIVESDIFNMKADVEHDRIQANSFKAQSINL